jgi:hypothetical protein
LPVKFNHPLGQLMRGARPAHHSFCATQLYFSETQGIILGEL